MTDIAAGKEHAHATGLAATLGHVRYVLGENRVTGFAFGLFVLIVLAALIGPVSSCPTIRWPATPRRR